MEFIDQLTPLGLVLQCLLRDNRQNELGELLIVPVSRDG